MGEVKTEYSEDELPLDQHFVTELLRWKATCPPSSSGWVFPSPLTDGPYHASEIQKDYLKPAGWKIGVVVNGSSVNIG